MFGINRFLILIAPAFGLIAGTANAASLINGDFETVPEEMVGVSNHLHPSEIGAPGKRTWDIFDHIPGWTISGGSAGVEFQVEKALGLKPQSGHFYIELDSAYGEPGKSNATISQDIFLDAGKYELSFFYSPRASNAGSNGISYSVTGADKSLTALAAGSVTGPSAEYGTAFRTWTRFSAVFAVSAPHSPISVAFSAIGSNDQYGGFLDSIDVKYIEPLTGATVSREVSAVPLPGGLPLLLVALAGIGFVGWRRSSV